MFTRAHHDRRSSPWPRSLRVAIATALLSALTVAQAVAGDGNKDWISIGHDPENSRNQPFERDIGPSNVNRLAPLWIATTAGDVSATPAVSKGAVYFPDWGGKLWKLDAETGGVIWSHSISEYTGIANDISRTSPSLAGKTLVIGDLLAPNMMGIDAKTGELRWITQVHPHPAGIITGSPVLAADRVYVGISSRESSYDPAHGLVCCTFRGAVVALDAQTGRIVWRTYGLPENGGVPGGWAGAAIIAPPAVDLAAGLVYATHGNLYTTPPSVTACNAASPNGRAAVVVPRARPRPLGACVRRTTAHGDVVRTGIRRREVGPRRLGAERLPAGPRQAPARRRPRREERRLSPGGCEDRRVRLEHPRRPRRRPGRNGVGHGIRRRPHLRRDHQPAPHPLQADAFGRVRHRRLVGGARPGDRTDPLADRRPPGRVGPRTGNGRQRRPLRVVGGQDGGPDVRPRRSDGRDPLAVRRGQHGQLRPGRGRRNGLLGLRLREGRGRERQQQVLRVQPGRHVDERTRDAPV